MKDLAYWITVLLPVKLACSTHRTRFTLTLKFLHIFTLPPFFYYCHNLGAHSQNQAGCMIPCPTRWTNSTSIWGLSTCSTTHAWKNFCCRFQIQVNICHRIFLKPHWTLQHTFSTENQETFRQSGAQLLLFWFPTSLIS